WVCIRKPTEIAPEEEEDEKRLFSIGITVIMAAIAETASKAKQDEVPAAKEPNIIGIDEGPAAKETNIIGIAHVEQPITADGG
ncbi:hypothetical protein MTO96_037493, partial [Rhipicephalus appendiculatus]